MEHAEVKSASAPSFLALQTLTKTFGEVIAVRDVSLEVARGELMVLLGPSGCGKTTVLRMIAGLEVPDSGAIRMGGRLIRDATHHVAMVFHGVNLYPHKRLGDNVAFPLRVSGLSSGEIANRVDEAATLLGIGSLLKRFPHELSNGEAQRGALAKALARRPELLLLDEPLSGLDAELRLRLRTEIRGIVKTLQVTTVMVTHDQDEAMALGDRIAVMHAGRCEQVGTSSELYSRPANTFVGRFLGDPGMNLISAECLDGVLRATSGECECHWEQPLPPQVTDGSLFIGLRPGALRIADAGEGGCWLRGQVVSVEQLEPVPRAVLRVGDALVTVLNPGRETMVVGRTVTATFNPDEAVLFRGNGAQERIWPVWADGCSDGPDSPTWRADQR